MAKHIQSIYFARVGRYVKIGCSTDVTARLRGLSAAALIHPPDLEDIKPTLIGAFPGGYELESDIHADLWEWQAAGEWFEATPFVLAHIAGLLSVGHEADAA